MGKILVCGLTNIETTLRVDAFPVAYTPVNYPFFGVHSSVSGVGYNIAKALTVLGDEVNFVSIIGQDPNALLVRDSLHKDRLKDNAVLALVEQTPQSVILYDAAGQREIFVDLKDVQECAYPQPAFAEALNGCSLAALCNINFSRPFLQTARQAGILTATDVHVISQLDDPYNADFMAAADILFMSNEWLPCSPEDWARAVLERYSPKILVIGMGAQGALMAVRADGYLQRWPAVHTRPVVSTIGAGDALFSAFLHCFGQDHDPYNAIRKAIVFASYKIGETGAAQGFMEHGALVRLAG